MFYLFCSRIFRHVSFGRLIWDYFYWFLSRRTHCFTETALLHNCPVSKNPRWSGVSIARGVSSAPWPLVLPLRPTPLTSVSRVMLRDLRELVLVNLGSIVDRLKLLIFWFDQLILGAFKDCTYTSQMSLVPKMFPICTQKLCCEFHSTKPGRLS